MTRPMTPELAAALDALTPAQRRVLPVIAGESEHDWLGALLLGLAAEVPGLERRDEIERMREITVLHALEVDHLADVDRIAEGATWPTEPEDRSKGVAWFPWAVPDTIEGVET
jgi:hypothetical protein